MSKQFWTILIVPPGNERTRAIRIGLRGRRALATAAGGMVLLLVVAIVVVFTPLASPGARLVARENQRLRDELALLDSRFSALGDTLTALGVRDQQMRLLAGLSTGNGATAASDTSQPAGSQVGPPAPAGGSELPKPFLGRLGFGKRPDVEGMIQRATELASSFRAVSDTLTRNFERLANTPSIMPTVGWLSSHFTESRFHPILHANLPHEGIDVAAPMGAPIIAPAAGRVLSVNTEQGYGRVFEIDHGNGIVTKFAHCSQIMVHVGQLVTRGQLIAAVGNTGLSTGPHLHYEVHVNGKPVDPLKYVVLPGKIAD